MAKAPPAQQPTKSSPKTYKAGAGGGLGRLEKVKAYGSTPGKAVKAGK